MSICRFAFSTVLLGLFFLNGCSTHAPIHVFRPSPLPQATRVAIGAIDGDAETVRRIRQAVAASQPRHASRVRLVSLRELESKSPIQLASFDGGVSPLASNNAAKQANVDAILHGHIIRQEFTDGPDSKIDMSDPNAAGAMLLRSGVNGVSQLPSRPDLLVIGWEIVDVHSGFAIDSQTISINSLEADELFPDLRATNDPSQKVVSAIARQTWASMAAYTEETDVDLSQPFFTPGARGIRRGNRLAQEGNWQQAEMEWQDVVKSYPYSHAAWHNLAIAAAAKEEFELASVRLEKADWSWLSDDRADKSLVWLETQQRKYHEAYNLPPPANGWKIPNPVIMSSTEIDPAEPRDIEQLPWWSGIPFVKPPEWSWRQFLTQPIPL
jgi:hypothetical protein